MQDYWNDFATQYLPALTLVLVIYLVARWARTTNYWQKRAETVKRRAWVKEKLSDVFTGVLENLVVENVLTPDEAKKEAKDLAKRYPGMQPRRSLRGLKKDILHRLENRDNQPLPFPDTPKGPTLRERMSTKAKAIAAGFKAEPKAS